MTPDAKKALRRRARGLTLAGLRSKVRKYESMDWESEHERRDQLTAVALFQSEIERRARQHSTRRVQGCTCIHRAAHHCPVTGACLVTNDRIGPCPCGATPEETREALRAVFEWRQDMHEEAI